MAGRDASRLTVSTFPWIVVAGVAMSLLALSGSATFVLPDRVFDRVVLPLVAVAAGSLVGGALFHMLPAAVDRLGNVLSVYVWLAAGLFSFFLLEQYLMHLGSVATFCVHHAPCPVLVFRGLHTGR